MRIYNFSSGQCLGECRPPPGRVQGEGAHACELTCVRGYHAANLAYIVAVGWSREVWVWPDQREGLGFEVKGDCL